MTLREGIKEIPKLWDLYKLSIVYSVVMSTLAFLVAVWK